MSGTDLREPWIRLDADQARAFEAEATKAIVPGHELDELNLTAIAECAGCDDAVFRASDGTFAIVHLTWSSEGPESLPYPRTTRLVGFVAVETAMDQHEH